MSNMVDGLIFPDTRACFEDLLAGEVHLGQPITFTWHLQAGDYGALVGPFPLVHILPPTGTQGIIDRVERVVLECYAEGTNAVNTLESVTASIVGWNIETAHGMLDNVQVVSTPHDVSYQHETLNKAQVILDVTMRPVN